jgi:hypothetical protein
MYINAQNGRLAVRRVDFRENIQMLSLLSLPEDVRSFKTAMKCS